MASQADQYVQSGITEMENIKAEKEAKNEAAELGELAEKIFLNMVSDPTTVNLEHAAAEAFTAAKVFRDFQADEAWKAILQINKIQLNKSKS